MMKFILTTILLLTCLTTHARPKKIMVCLGKEEQYIHKNKIGGAFFKLNQDLIGALLQFPRYVKMTPKVYQQVCPAGSKFPSLSLLKHLILNSTMLFYVDADKNEVSQMAISKLAIDELQKKSLHIFIDFLNALQAEAPTVNCIVNSIEELKVTYLNLRYLEEELGTQKIFDSLSKKQIIFQKLERAPEIIQSCKKVKGRLKQ